jgi:nitrile hydratase subunit beta
MNGVHDMGGMQGLGPIDPEQHEPVFHEPWEARVFALVRAMGAWRKWNIDASRFQREQIPAAEYLRMSYYEKWFAGLNELMVAKGLVTAAELASGKAAPHGPQSSPALTADKVPMLVSKGSPSNRTTSATPLFDPGQSIRTRNMNPLGHTRLPRYARGRAGTIDRVHGVFVFPDTNALYQGENPQYLYSVKFTAHELWGKAAAPQDSVYIDLWESYLER